MPRQTYRIRASAWSLRTDAICANLERLRGFRFANRPERPISEKRSDLPDSLVQHQLEQEGIRRIGFPLPPASGQPGFPDVFYDPADKARAAKGRDNVKAIDIGRDLPGDFRGDFHSKVLTLFSICAAIEVDDFLVHRNPGNFAVHKAGIALADDGHDPSEYPAPEGLPCELQIFQRLR